MRKFGRFSALRALFAIYESRKVHKCLLLRTVYLKTGYHFSDCALVDFSRCLNSYLNTYHPPFPVPPYPHVPPAKERVHDIEASVPPVIAVRV